LHLAVESLVNDAVAQMLTAGLRTFAVSISFVQLLGQELKELVGILLLGGNEVFERLLLGYPECRKNACSSVTISMLQGEELLIHVIHRAAQAIHHLAITTLVAVAKVEVPEKRIVKKALQNHVLVTRCSSVVNATETVGTTWRSDCVGSDVAGIFLSRVCE
jgi:hypothetical protein